MVTLAAVHRHWLVVSYNPGSSMVRLSARGFCHGDFRPAYARYECQEIFLNGSRSQSELLGVLGGYGVVQRMGDSPSNTSESMSGFGQLTQRVMCDLPNPYDRSATLHLAGMAETRGPRLKPQTSGVS